MRHVCGGGGHLGLGGAGFWCVAVCASSPAPHRPPIELGQGEDKEWLHLRHLEKQKGNIDFVCMREFPEIQICRPRRYFPSWEKFLDTWNATAKNVELGSRVSASTPQRAAAFGRYNLGSGTSNSIPF